LVKRRETKEEGITFGKKKGNICLLFSFFLLFSSSGRKKPKEEIKRR
jgi:hypothetical protein